MSNTQLLVSGPSVFIEQTIKVFERVCPIFWVLGYYLKMFTIASRLCFIACFVSYTHSPTSQVLLQATAFFSFLSVGKEEISGRLLLALFLLPIHHRLWSCSTSFRAGKQFLNPLVTARDTAYLHKKRNPVNPPNNWANESGLLRKHFPSWEKQILPAGVQKVSQSMPTGVCMEKKSIGKADLIRDLFLLMDNANL